MKRLPKIVLLTTGGTIAMRAEGAGGGVPKLGAAELLQSVPQLTQIAEVEGRDVLAKPSSSLTLDDLQLLARTADAIADADGIVVTHGTDTLEETAFVLQLIARTALPIVFTGAMRRADLPGADGPANLIDACRVAASPLARGKGVLVVLNGEIHSALFARKAHSFLPNAFQSLGQLGWVAEDRVRFFLAPALSYPRLALGGERPQVPLIEAGLEFGALSLSFLDAAHVDGVVLSLTGAGHVAAAAVDDLERLARSKPVIFASRSGQGETFQNTYGYVGGESDLIRRGLIPAGFLSPRQARLVLLLLLSGGAGLDAVRAGFERFWV